MHLHHGVVGKRGLNNVRGRVADRLEQSGVGHQAAAGRDFDRAIADAIKRRARRVGEHSAIDQQERAGVTIGPYSQLHIYQGAAIEDDGARTDR